jgi:hypothetical protein
MLEAAADRFNKLDHALQAWRKMDDDEVDRLVDKRYRALERLAYAQVADVGDLAIKFDVILRYIVEINENGSVISEREVAMLQAVGRDLKRLGRGRH